MAITWLDLVEAAVQGLTGGVQMVRISVGKGNSRESSQAQASLENLLVHGNSPNQENIENLVHESSLTLEDYRKFMVDFLDLKDMQKALRESQPAIDFVKNFRDLSLIAKLPQV